MDYKKNALTAMYLKVPVNVSRCAEELEILALTPKSDIFTSPL
jgi:hypothetical protein